MFVEHHLNSRMNTPSSTPTLDTHHHQSNHHAKSVDAMPLFVVHSRTGSKGVSLTQLGLGHLVVGARLGKRWMVAGGTRRIQLQPGVAAVARMEMWQEHPKRKILHHLTNPGVGYLQIAWFHWLFQGPLFWPISTQAPCLFVRSSESCSKPLGQRPRSLAAPGLGQHIQGRSTTIEREEPSPTTRKNGYAWKPWYPDKDQNIWMFIPPSMIIL